MKSKTVERLMNETPQHIKDFVDDYAEKLVNKVEEQKFSIKDMRMSFEAGQEYQSRFEKNLSVKGKKFGDFIQSLKTKRNENN